MTSEHVIDVVVLTWNDGDQLRVAVDSALASTGVDVRVIVVDNGSDPTPMLPADTRVLMIRNDENRGVAPARNQGARAGTNPFVCFLDSDARLEPDCLVRLMEPFAAEESVVLSAPVFVDQAPEESAGRAPSVLVKARRALNLTSSYEPVAAPMKPWWDVDFAIGACQLFQRSAFDSVGGLDESYFYGPEDVDFCLRLREKGGRIVQVRDARCHHPPRRRYKRLMTRRGAQHAWAVARHLWRHRRFRVRVGG